MLEIIQQEYKQQHTKWKATITFKEFIQGLRKWKEETSTSPSGQHLGIYKALLTAHKDYNLEFSNKDDKGFTPQQKAEAILRTIHSLANHAASFGFFLKRWVKVINVMIYKTMGCHELKKLRVIHLFKAHFNFIVGILFGRREMYHQIDNKTTHKG